jgi:hypothetical protein
MKRIFIILSLVCTWIFLGYRSCSTGMDGASSQNQLNRLRDSLMGPFMVVRPSLLTRRMMEEKAMEKLLDWNDCMRLAADTGTPEPLRRKAVEMSGRFFADARYFDEAEKWYAMHGHLQPDSLRIEQLLTRTSDSTLSGVLSFGSESGKQKVGFVARPNRKAFGEDTIRIWDVFLTDFER